jgi:hypothetical protein
MTKKGSGWLIIVGAAIVAYLLWAKGTETDKHPILVWLGGTYHWNAFGYFLWTASAVLIISGIIKIAFGKTGPQ